VTQDLLKNDIPESALYVPNAVLPTIIIDSENEQPSHSLTTGLPALNTTVGNVTVANVITTVPQVTCHSVHTADETFPPASSSSSVSSSKTSASDVHGIDMICTCSKNSVAYADGVLWGGGRGAGVQTLPHCTH